MAHPTLAELSLALSHVQSLLSDLTAEVKVITSGITHLVQEEKLAKERSKGDNGDFNDDDDDGDEDEELDYLDVDPWSNVNEQERASAFGSDHDDDGERNGGSGGGSRSRRSTTAGGGGMVASAVAALNGSNPEKKTRKDSIRSLLQRRPSTVKDETKALARILSQKGRTSSLRHSTTAGSPDNQHGNEDQTQQHHHHSGDNDSAASSESGSTSGSGGIGGSSTSSGGTATPSDQRQEFSITRTNGSTLLDSDAVPHTITVQTRNVQKYALAFTKPTTPQSATVPSLSTLASQPQPSLLGASNGNGGSGSGGGSVPGTPNATSANNPPPFWRSSTMPITESSASRPSSMSNIYSTSFESNGKQGNISTHSSRRSIDARTLTSDHYGFAGNGNGKSGGNHPILHPGVGKDPVHQTFRPPPSSSATHVERVESVDCFSKLGLSPELLRGIYAYGLKMPTFLQQRGIPMIMTRQDVLAQTKPEIAKTVTYAIPLLHFLTLPATSIHPQLIILCSNNDLCLHVQRVLLALARFMPTISCLICADGDNATISHGTLSTTQVKLQQQQQQGRNPTPPNKRHSNPGTFTPSTEYLPPIAAHVVIGTPAKVLHLLRTRQISTKALKVLLLENADVLLLAPFKEATIALLSMVREAPGPMTNGYSSVGRMGGGGGGGGINATSASSGAAQSSSLASPPNSGPTSPVSMAVAALNSRIMNANGGGSGATSPGSTMTQDGNSRSSSPLKSPPTQQQQQVQFIFLSTDVPSYVLDYVAQYMTQPTKALVKGHDLALKGILQFYRYLTMDDDDWRAETLCDILEESGVHRAVVFCNSAMSVDRVLRKVWQRNQARAIGLHEDMDVIARKNALGVFRQTAPPAYLVTTDALVKDLEILGVPLVVSYEVPAIPNYISRVKWIDRTGGRIGIKVTLVDGQRGEAAALRAIQQHYRTPIDDMPPSIADLIIN
ncbi:translation initiation factor eIF4A [Actinomortierella wolfii]|nr:translation initiation factor eIF4A [Actinomortierella wolfii]